MPKFGMPISKSKNIFSDSNPWLKYNFDIEVKGQGHTKFMNVHNTSYHGDTLTCLTKYDNVKEQNSWGLNTNQIHAINPINLTLRSKVNIESGTWMYVSHLLMVKDPCANYGMPMSNQNMLWPGHKDMSKTLQIWLWGQS